jgi:hypothetical protein
VGVFTALDPFEGMMQRPMSLNGYSYVEGNPITNSDPSGKQRDCSADKLKNCALEGSECEVICLFADRWMETARKFNDPAFTNLSDEAFAAMIAAKFIFEDATRFNSTSGLLNQLFSGAGTDLTFRSVWEQFNEISFGPGNIPLAQAINAAEWWRENASCLGFNPSIFNTGLYDEAFVQQCFPTPYSVVPRCTIISTPSNRATIELNSFEGQTTWDEWLAVIILQAAFRARTINERNDTRGWNNPRVVDGDQNQLSVYILARAQLDWTKGDSELYDLILSNFMQGAYDWTRAVTSIRDNTHEFWPELNSLYTGGYREFTDQERAAFNLP